MSGSFVKKGLVVFGVLVLVVTPILTNAQEIVELLDGSLPEVGSSVPASYKGLISYLSAIFRLGVGFAIALSVLMFAIGGIQYMTSDAIPVKESARSRINNAVLGLLLALLSYVILLTINPALVSFDLSSTGGGGAGSGGNGTEWGEDTGVRNQLRSKGVTVNKYNCAQVGQTNCTSLYGLPLNAINGLVSLKAACECSIQVTGGTEEWLHETHGPGKLIVDVSATGGLNDHLTGSRSNPANGTCVTSGGAKYTFETPGGNSTGYHWHVNYGGGSC